MHATADSVPDGFFVAFRIDYGKVIPFAPRKRPWYV